MRASGRAAVQEKEGYGAESDDGWVTTRSREGRGRKEPRIGGASTAEGGAATAKSNRQGLSSGHHGFFNPLAGDVELGKPSKA